MGLINILGESLELLEKEPLLFLPKLLSTTLYIPAYLWFLQNSRIAFATRTIPQDYYLSFALLILLSPLWWYLDALYPFLVEQREKGKASLALAAKQTASRFLHLVGLLLLITLPLTLISLPFILLLALGYAQLQLIFLIPGALGLLAILLISTYALYYAPTTLLIDSKGIFASLKTGWSISRSNSMLTWLLTIFTLSFTLLIIFIGGTLEQQLAIIGFILGRYIGAILTVYLYVVNPVAYLEAKSS